MLRREPRACGCEIWVARNSEPVGSKSGSPHWNFRNWLIREAA
jgi:hypothetical protein